ncbi:MAG: LysR family transcriptional regulator [Hyphomicrobiales bacterium]|nr:LysR family transcriptional regulator [Hyphomicrobiales bacterium]
MAATPALDLDLVRTLVLIAEEKSFTRAADRVGRTQSAVSLQVQRLEALVGHMLLVRGKGSGVELTPHGEELVKRGRELLALNDEIVRSLHARTAHDAVRLSVSEAFTRRCLPDILARFGESEPDTLVEITRGASCELVPKLKAGELDLMLCEGGHEPRQWPAVELWRTRLEWITSDAHGRHLDDPLPLSLSPGNCPFRPPWLDECIWRGSALRALERACRRYAIVSTSTSITAQQAAALAGIAVTVATISGLPEGLRPTRPDEGLPELPEVSLLLLKARDPRQPATDALHDHIVQSFGVKGHDVGL